MIVNIAENEGAIVEVDLNKSILIHYGLWTRNRCTYCGKQG
ncbi:MULTISPECIES: hypothetical protein [Bacillus cereus group]|nr:hypothetical protein [Bacillus thuringiensis]